MLSEEAKCALVLRLPTTSAKIRALARAGVSRAEIARYLDIRYQHVRNVLVQPAPKSEAGVEPASSFSRAVEAVQAGSENSRRDNLRVPAEGTVTIPADALNAAGIVPGDTLLLRIVNGEIRISGYAAAFRRAQQFAERYGERAAGGVDDFIAERRALGARGD